MLSPKTICLLLYVLLISSTTPFLSSLFAFNMPRGEHRITFIDSNNDLPLSGISLSIDKQTYCSDISGNIILPDSITLPTSIRLYSVSHGIQRIIMRRHDTLWISPSHEKQLTCATVRGTHQTVSRNMVSEKIDSKVIDNSTGKNLAQLLTKISGVSCISNGTTNAKPVIHGMYGHRILLLNNGVRQTGQQWGVEHAPEVDMHAAEEISVIKGSDAVRYGSDAVGGVIIMQPRALPFAANNIHGKTIVSGNTNGYRYQCLTQCEGSSKHIPQFAWRLQANYANGGDRRTAHYTLNNTGTRQHNIHLTLGYQLPHLRIQTFYQYHNNKLGVMWSAKMGSKDILKERIELGKPQYILPYTRHIAYPYQHIHHHTWAIEADYSQPHWGHWYWQTAYQKDLRKEYNVRRMNHSKIPAVALNLWSLQHRFRWQKHQGYNKIEVGAQYINTNNYSTKGTGVQPIIPNYINYELGLYTLLKHHAKKWGTEIGFRYDHQYTHANGYDAYNNQYGGKRRFNSFSGQWGAHFNLLPQLLLTTNLALAWRAPHVFEMYSNGHEVGSGMFVKGDSLMKAEHSRKGIMKLEWDNSLIHVSLDGYLQWIDGYIYDTPTHHNIATIAGVYPLFQYKQTGAWFSGIDADILLHISPHLDYHLSAAQIWAHELHTHNYLPYIPSFRLRQKLSWQSSILKLPLTLQIGHQLVTKQKRFNPDVDLINDSPRAYNIFSSSAAINFHIGAYKSTAGISINNLFNKSYKEYTNRSRYYAHDLGRDISARLQINF